MTREDRDFVEWYRKYFRSDVDLPCLKCTDEKIVKCSNTDVHFGCVSFHQYIHQKERPKI
jgi:hypothetical protein